MPSNCRWSVVRSKNVKLPSGKICFKEEQSGGAQFTECRYLERDSLLYTHTHIVEILSYKLFLCFTFYRTVYLFSTLSSALLCITFTSFLHFAFSPQTKTTVQPIQNSVNQNVPPLSFGPQPSFFSSPFGIPRLHSWPHYQIRRHCCQMPRYNRHHVRPQYQHQYQLYLQPRRQIPLRAKQRGFKRRCSRRAR